MVRLDSFVQVKIYKSEDQRGGQRLGLYLLEGILFVIFKVLSHFGSTSFWRHCGCVDYIIEVSESGKSKAVLRYQ